MFKVNIKNGENDKVYYVYDSGELVETKKLPEIYGCFAYDFNKYRVSCDILSNGNGLSVVLTHLEPVIIAEDKIVEFLNSYHKNGGDDFLPCTPITQDDYHMLFNYATYTNQLDEEFLKEKEVADDIESTKKYLKEK